MKAALLYALVVAVQAATAFPDLIKPEIVGGDEARPHEFPWQVGIHIFYKSGLRTFCGGSLIAKRWVLSAAHCVDPGRVEVVRFEVTLGAHQIDVTNESGRVTYDIPASKGFANPEWEGVFSDSVGGDIALIELPEDAPLSDAIQIIRLPSEQQKKESFFRRTVTISGWGQQHNGDEHKAPILRKLTSIVVSNLYCKLRFRIAKDSNICISGWGSKGACHGDSGGPMVLYEKDGPTLIGVTSFGNGRACDSGWPSVFTRVTSYLDWVNSHIKA